MRVLWGLEQEFFLSTESLKTKRERGPDPSGDHIWETTSGLVQFKETEKLWQMKKANFWDHGSWKLAHYPYHF